MKNTLSKKSSKNLASWAAEGPRERAFSRGIAALSDLDLVQTILGSGIRGSNVADLSRKVLGILEARTDELKPQDLALVPGVGMAKSVLLCAALELSRRLFSSQKIKVKTPLDAFGLVRHYADRPKEQFICLCLNGAHEVVKIQVVTVGLINKTLVHPREVFVDAIHERACAIMVAHNHPSGTLDPSREDLEVTERIKNAGAILGIPLLDHIIFSHESFYSFMEQGHLR